MYGYFPGITETNVYEGETFGEDGTIGRDSEADVILRTRFMRLSKTSRTYPSKPMIWHESINSNDATKNL